MRGDALQTFRNTSSRNRETVAEILTVFRRKYVKPESMVLAICKIRHLVFNPANQKVIYFLDELQKLAENAFKVAAQAIIEHFIYAKIPPHLEKPINQVHLEKGTYEQTVSHLEKKLEPNGLDDRDKLQMNTVTKQVTQQKPEKPKLTCHHCKKPGQHKKPVPSTQTRKRQSPKKTRIVLTITTILILAKQTLTPTIKFLRIPTQTTQLLK